MSVFIYLHLGTCINGWMVGAHSDPAGFVCFLLFKHESVINKSKHVKGALYVNFYLWSFCFVSEFVSIWPVMLVVRVCWTEKMFLHIFLTPLLLIFLTVAAELIKMADTKNNCLKVFLIRMRSTQHLNLSRWPTLKIFV